MYSLVWNEADPSSDTAPEKLYKANYATKKEAMEQAKHDYEVVGKRVVGVTDDDDVLVWKTKEYSKKKRLVRTGAVEHAWAFEE